MINNLKTTTVDRGGELLLVKYNYMDTKFCNQGFYDTTNNLKITTAVRGDELLFMERSSSLPHEEWNELTVSD